VVSECVEVTCSAKESSTDAWREACDDAGDRAPGSDPGMCEVLDRGRAARLAHAGSIGACRADRQAATGIRCLARVDHLSRPGQLVGAQFVFGDAITPRPAGRWRPSDIDGSTSPWCRRPRPLDHSACGVTTDLDAATPKTARDWRGIGRPPGRRKRAGIASGGLSARSVHGTTIRRDHRPGVTGDARK